MKKLVDEVVDEMERLPAVAKCYDEWQMLQGEVEGYYSDVPPKKQKLPERKEFRQIKNAVVAEAFEKAARAGMIQVQCALGELLLSDDLDVRDSPAGAVG